MKIDAPYLATLSDSDLIANAKRLAADERRATAELVAFIGEIDARKLYLAQGLASLFEYCRRVLGLDEGATYNRIEAARAARRLPLILNRLSQGTITLTAVRLLAPHLNKDNVVALLDEAKFASAGQVRTIVARLNPLPDVPSTVRKVPARGTVAPVPAIEHGLRPRKALPETRHVSAAARAVSGTEQEGTAGELEALAPGGELWALRSAAADTASARAGTAVMPSPGVLVDSAPREPASCAVRSLTDAAAVSAVSRVALPPEQTSSVVAPRSPGCYKVQMTIDEETRDDLRAVQDLVRHRNPKGDVAIIFREALSLLREKLERQKMARLRPKRAADGDEAGRDGPVRGLAAAVDVDGEGARTAGGDTAARASRHATTLEPTPGEPPPGVPLPAVKKKCKAKQTKAPGSGKRTRYIPADVRRAVFERDGQQCSLSGGKADARKRQG